MIASAHIKFKNIDEYLLIINKIKKIFQQKGIFETTIEPEFLKVCFKNLSFLYF